MAKKSSGMKMAKVGAQKASTTSGRRVGVAAGAKATKSKKPSYKKG